MMNTHRENPEKLEMFMLVSKRLGKLGKNMEIVVSLWCAIVVMIVTK